MTSNNNNNEDHDLTIRIETELETTSENFDRLHDTIQQSFLDESILPLAQPPQFNTSSSHLDSASNSSHYLKTLNKSNTTATNITPGAGGLKVPNPSISISQFPSILKTQTSPFNFSKLNFSRTSDPRSGGKALSLEEKLRIWRHDAIHQNLLLTAEFWGDKLVQLTSKP
jgi:anaphase-promoting complex subunit 6